MCEPPVLMLEALQVSFGDVRAVDGVSLTVRSGELVGYLGPNGAGKTTTLKCIAGLVSGFSGTIEVDGVDATANPLAVKQQLGFLPESGEIYEVLSPREYLEFLADVRGIERDRALAYAGELLDMLALEPKARETRMHDFSKGMKQKVALAATMMHRPRLLLLDEPLSGLDVNAAARFKRLLQRYVEDGGTVLYSSHILDVVERLCARAVVLNNGRVLAELHMASLAQDHPGKTLEQIFHELTGLSATGEEL